MSYFFANPTEEATISIFNLQGQEFAKKTLKNVEGQVNHTINTSELSAGMYIVTLQNGSKREVTKLVVTK